MCPAAASACPPGEEQSLLARARPYTLLGTPDTVSFYSAAEVHCFKLPRNLVARPSPASAGLLHLTRCGAAAPRRKGVIGHRSAAGTRRRRGSLDGVSGHHPCRGPCWIWPGRAHLALDDLVVIADDLVCEHTRYHHPRTARVPLPELLAYAGRHYAGGWPAAAQPGARAGPRRRRLPSRNPAPPTARPPVLPGFEPNYVLTDPQGSPLWVDLACPEYRLAVEYDGGHHLTPAQQHCRCPS